MTSGPTLRSQIVDALVRHSKSGLTATAVTDETVLVGGGLDLESVAFLEAMVEIETVCGLPIQDESLTEGAMASVGAFVAHVSARQALGGAGGTTRP